MKSKKLLIALENNLNKLDQIYICEAQFCCKYQL